MPSNVNVIGTQTQLSAIEFAQILRDPSAYTAKIEQLTTLIEQANTAQVTAEQIIHDAQKEASDIRAKAESDIALRNDEFNSKIAKVQGEWERKALELDRRDASLRAEEDEMTTQLAQTANAEEEHRRAANAAVASHKAAQERYQEYSGRINALNAKIKSFTDSVNS